MPEVGDIFEKLFAEGHDTPVEDAATLVLFLASGRGDDLSERYISVKDDWETLVGDAKQPTDGDLQTIGLRTWTRTASSA